MTTITSVELRNNFEKIIKRAMAGEEFKVTYRNQPAIRLVSDAPKKMVASGLNTYLAEPYKAFPFDKSKTWKELYYDHVNSKYS